MTIFLQIFVFWGCMQHDGIANNAKATLAL